MIQHNKWLESSRPTRIGDCGHNFITFRLIPLGFSKSRLIKMLRKSVGAAPIFTLWPDTSYVATWTLLGISFSELRISSLLVPWVIITSSATGWPFEKFPLPRGDAETANRSGGDGRGDSESLSLAVVFEEIPGLITDFGGPEKVTEAKQKPKEIGEAY